VPPPRPPQPQRASPQLHCVRAALAHRDGRPAWDASSERGEARSGGTPPTVYYAGRSVRVLLHARRSPGIPPHAVVDPVEPLAAVMNQCGTSRAMGVCFLPVHPPWSAAAAGGARGADTKRDRVGGAPRHPHVARRRGQGHTRCRYRRRRPERVDVVDQRPATDLRGGRGARLLCLFRRVGGGQPLPRRRRPFSFVGGEARTGNTNSCWRGAPACGQRLEGVVRRHATDLRAVGSRRACCAFYSVGSWYHPDERQTSVTKTKRTHS